MNRWWFSPIIFLLSLNFLGFSPQTDSTSEEKKAEQAADTTWLTYVQPNEFSIQYPSYWKLYEGSRNIGTGIVGFSKHHSDSCKNETCGMCPNSAGVSLSIYSKELRTLREIADESVGYDDVWEFKMDSVLLDGQKVIRIHSIEDGYSVIKTFFDYPGSQYVCLYGKYSRGKDSIQFANDLEQIQNSFKTLK